MKAKDLDKIFDDGEVDINDHLDLSKAFRPGQEQKRVNVDFPVWMIERLDREANRIGVPRQSLIKILIAAADTPLCYLGVRLASRATGVDPRQVA